MSVLQKVKLANVKAEENLTENRNFLLNSYELLELIPSPLAYLNKLSQYEYVNKAYCDLYNTDGSNILGKSIPEFLGTAVFEKIRAYVEMVLAGEVVNFIVELPYEDSYRMLQATCTPRLDSEGNVTGFLASLNDMTARQLAEKSLEESEHRYRRLIENLPAAVYTTDKDGFITMYNTAAVELWGRHPEIGREMWCGSWKIYELDGTTILPLNKCPIAIALAEKRKVIITDPLVVERPDGSRRFFIPYPEPLFDSRGNMTGAFNLLVDVTESKLAETEKARLAAIVQSSDDAILGMKLNGIITSWNKGAEKLFGYTEEEMLHEVITKLVPEDRLDEHPEILRRLRNGESIEHFETKRITKEGNLVDVSLTVSPVKDAKGNIIGASKIARDITERKKVDEI
ncbi:MAG TPA: PAS domain S-box protein, partial [Chitinophagaceae bacterium]|nr:PAS domain S-box protein [Chitinophagaceae bacterium]